MRTGSLSGRQDDGIVGADRVEVDPVEVDPASVPSAEEAAAGGKTGEGKSGAEVRFSYDGTDHLANVSSSCADLLWTVGSGPANIPSVGQLDCPFHYKKLAISDVRVIFLPFSFSDTSFRYESDYGFLSQVMGFSNDLVGAYDARVKELRAGIAIQSRLVEELRAKIADQPRLVEDEVRRRVQDETASLLEDLGREKARLAQVDQECSEAKASLLAALDEAASIRRRSEDAARESEGRLKGVLLEKEKKEVELMKHLAFRDIVRQYLESRDDAQKKNAELARVVGRIHCLDDLQRDYGYVPPEGLRARFEADEAVLRNSIENTVVTFLDQGDLDF